MIVARAEDFGDIRPETPLDRAAVEAVTARAFGPGHLARTAERLREGRTPAIGFTWRRNGEVAGTVRLWTIRVGATPALFLGPIAVERDERNGGVGGDLVHACLSWAEESDRAGVLLVGDPPYFQRFGFSLAPEAVLPGPVDRRRVMWRGVAGRAAPSGAVRPD